MVFMAASLLKSLRDELRQTELHDAMIRERVLRTLEEHEAQSQVATASELVSQAMAQGEEAQGGESSNAKSRQH